MINMIFSALDIILPFKWLEPEFMKRALLALLCVAPACAAMGVMVVNFRMAFFSDAVSHSAFTGVALGLLFAINPMITLVIFGVLVGLGITQLRSRTDLPTDTIIGVFFSGAVALGIVIISHRRALGRLLEAFLYGDVLAISRGDLKMMFVLLIVVLGFIGYSYNELFLIGLNEDLSRTRGTRVKLYNYAFSILLALVVTVSIRAIGILLVTAMLIVPAATARTLAKSAGGMFWYAIGVSLISAVSGLAASYHFDTATGATVILVATILFALSYPARLILKG
jgi:zinc transport system permease protein